MVGVGFAWHCSTTVVGRLALDFFPRETQEESWKNLQKIPKLSQVYHYYLFLYRTFLHVVFRVLCMGLFPCPHSPSGRPAQCNTQTASHNRNPYKLSPNAQGACAALFCSIMGLLPEF